MNRIVSINAGGKIFQTYLATLVKYPETKFANIFQSAAGQPNHADQPGVSSDFFLDVSPEVFDPVLNFLRTNRISLPTTNESLRQDLVNQLNAWELMPYAFPPVTAEGGGDGEVGIVELPDVCVVQMCDHMQHDQGVKRHAMTITFGADGFQLRSLSQLIRKDLNQQLSSTYWQCYQTNERAVFFTTTKVANGAADLLTTSITQQVIHHTESLGYHLVSSYITLSPDVVHTSVRMFIHNFIFRRARLPLLEDGDAPADDGDAINDLETFQNFEPRHVGPQKIQWTDSMPADAERASNIWKE